MKQFIIFLCLTFVVLATAENGYNYPQPAPQRPAVAPKAPIYSPVQAPPLQTYLPPAPQGNYGSYGGSQSSGQSGFNYPQPQFGAPQAPAYQHGQEVNNYHQHIQSSQGAQRQQIVTKDIYIHSAPEEQEDSSEEDTSVNAPIRKNYRIVFIKAPSTNFKLATNALKHAQSANEEKTVIYVLSKKPDLSEVQAQLQQVQGDQKSSKPEVYFIKYKTHEEAARAQQEIQAQYDALGGSTHVSDEGYAPVTSVGSLSSGFGSGHGGAIPISQYARTAQHGYSQQSHSSVSGSRSSVSGSSGGYLPPKTKK